jgi:hypothetical protein
MPKKARIIPRARRIQDVKERNEAKLMSIDDVVGVAIGEKDKKPCLIVYVAKASPKLTNAIPKEIEGFEVLIEESGEFVALPTPPREKDGWD